MRFNTIKDSSLYILPRIITGPSIIHSIFNDLGEMRLMIRIGQNKVIKILICVLIISIASVGIYLVINAISPVKQLGIDSTDTDIAKVDLAKVGNITITSIDLASFRIIV
jgi:hypothetical protein